MRIPMFLLFILFVLSDCKTKKKGNDSASNERKNSGKTNTKKINPVPHAKSEIEIAQARWPGTSENDLKDGKTIFDTKCTRCHASKEIVTRSEENWKKNIEKMAPRAKLSAEEKDKLTKYVLSYLEAHTSRD